MGTDYVTIVDNADPQMHVLVYRRAKDVQGNRWYAPCQSSNQARAPRKTA